MQRFEKVKNGIIQEPPKRTFTENSQIDDEAIPLNRKIEKMGDRMYTWENRRLLISYLRGDRNISQYSLKNLCIEAFDDYLYQMFTERYLSSVNGDKIELCRVLLDVDFYNSHYSAPTDHEVSIKNYRALISMLKNLSEESGASIDSVIHRSFIEHLKEHISEITPADKE
jgi:hypothetical protein